MDSRSTGSPQSKETAVHCCANSGLILCLYVQTHLNDCMWPKHQFLYTTSLVLMLHCPYNLSICSQLSRCWGHFLFSSRQRRQVCKLSWFMCTLISKLKIFITQNFLLKIFVSVPLAWNAHVEHRWTALLKEEWIKMWELGLSEKEPRPHSTHRLCSLGWCFAVTSIYVHDLHQPWATAMGSVD